MVGDFPRLVRAACHVIHLLLFSYVVSTNNFFIGTIFHRYVVALRTLPGRNESEENKDFILDVGHVSSISNFIINSLMKFSQL